MSRRPSAGRHSARRLQRAFADVCVAAPIDSAGRLPSRGPSAPSSTFTYSIPESLSESVCLGQIVWVPLGRRRVQGVVVALRRRSPVERTRDILAAVDERAALPPDSLAVAAWMSRHYIAPLFSCLRAMLPPGSLSREETVYFRTDRRIGFESLPEPERRVLGLFGRRRELPEAEIKRRVKGQKAKEALSQLLDDGFLDTRKRLAGPSLKPRTERVVRAIELASGEVEQRLRELRASKAADALALLSRPNTNSVAVEEVLGAIDASRAVLRRLEREGLIRITPAQTLVEAAVPSDQLEEVAAAALDDAPAQREVLSHLAETAEPVPLSQVLDETGRSSAVVTALVRRGLVRRTREPATITPIVKGVRAWDAEMRLRGLERYVASLAYLTAVGGAAPAKTLRDETGVTKKMLEKLSAVGLIELRKREVLRDPLSGHDSVRAPAPPLTTDQAQAWSRMRAALHSPWDGTAEEESGVLARRDSDSDSEGSALAVPPLRHQPRVLLLHGVTGSGKTELYLRAIEEVHRQGRQAIVLVPEIALTAQTIQRFVRRCPGRLGLWHSRLSGGERYDTWRRARRGDIDVVVGSRSALFAPLPRLGLIVLDEEHSDSYKQSNTPRYDARATAIRRAAVTGAVVVLGSATPRVESYWEASRGSFELLELPRRVATLLAHGLREGAEPGVEHGTAAGAPPVAESKLTAATWGEMPPVSIVDMRAELRAGNTSIFSGMLQDAMVETLESGQQMILFLNRRGSNTFVLCRDCGCSVQCPSCQLPLTYHGAGQDLVCHHCNHREPPPMMCPECGSTRIRYFGVGTQRVESVVQELFPDARTLRWDADTTKRRGSHEAILAEFVQGRADILIGTQMVAKGLDLPRVTLVGVVSADTALNLPDFRSAERTFQLLSQVAGRAGRSELGGRVVFQTYHPDSPAIASAANHDYAGFYSREIRFRGEQLLPPYGRLIRLEHLSESSDRAAEETASRLAKRLRRRVAALGLPDTDIIGPAPAFFHHVRGRTRWHLVIRSSDPHALLEGESLGPGWRVDVDPVELL